MLLAPAARKLSLAAHLSFSVGWIGAAAAYIALAIAAANSEDAQTVRGAWIAMRLTGWYVIVPLAVASLLSGILMATGTRWGLFRHYWVVFSLVLTAVATAVLILHMPTVDATVADARIGTAAELDTLRADLVHPGIGLVLLIVILVLNVFKPRGLTSHGRRRAYVSDQV